MNESSQVRYLKQQIKNHLGLFFDKSVGELYNENFIQFLPFREAVGLRRPGIVIPVDIFNPYSIEDRYQVELNGTKLTLWNRLNLPDKTGWSTLPNEQTPLWFRHQSGTLIPAWNIFQNLFELLTFAEERKNPKRDQHGRFVAAYSIRRADNLLEVPAFNEAVAAIAMALVGLMEKNFNTQRLSELICPPVIVLSHDCDILYGGDFWTQSIRALRIVRPLAEFKLPRIDNIWWILRNLVTPKRFYFDNILGMIEIERLFAFYSTFYLLNGSGGRFGARNGEKPLPELFKAIPQSCEIGIHYNYDTYLNEKRFLSQLGELESHYQKKVISGRAHYLRFDSGEAFQFWEKLGIRVDESSGYSDRIGYRNGVGGCFQIFDSVDQKPLDIWEVPMTIMDQSVVRQYGDNAIKKFSEMLLHLSKIGGAMSVLFHPGVFFNPEIPDMRGVYHEMLIECRQIGAVSKTAKELAEEALKFAE